MQENAPSESSNPVGLTRHKVQNTHKQDKKSLDRVQGLYQNMYNTEKNKTQRLNQKALKQLED